MVNQDRVINNFCTMAEISSETRNERKMADFLYNKLNNMGLKVFEDKAGEKINGNAGNIIGVLKGNTKGKKILFSAHMDTVIPGKNVKTIRKDGVIYSAGETVLGADDKAGIAIILEMIEVIKEQNILHDDIILALTVAEEGGLNGAKNIDPKAIKADLGYVLDSDGGIASIVIKGPAQQQIEAIIQGKAAHAGIAPEEGVSAILIAAKAISKMRLGRLDDETTANIGSIEGGGASNIVPDKVIIKGEARSLDEMKLKSVTEEMKNCLEYAAREAGGKCTTEIFDLYPSICLEGNTDVIKIAVEAAKKIGITATLKNTGGGSDANIFNGYGIPTANLGIGMQKVHTTEEYIEEESLVNNSKYLVEIVKQANQF